VSEKLDEKQIAALKAKHGVDELHVLSASGVRVIVKAPTRDVWMRFKDLAADAKRRRVAFEYLLTACAVHPEGEGVAAILDKKPALAESFGAKLCEMAGLEEEARAEKL
jgi:hypothetical protein